MDSITHSNLQTRGAIQADLERKRQRIAELESDLQQSEELERAIANERDWMDTEVSDLSAMARRKDQLQRQNYTVVRDCHSNSEAVRRLQMVKEVYAENIQKVEIKEAMLKERESVYEEQSSAIEARELVVLNCERRVSEMEDRLTNLGASFSGTLGKSQQELEALDMLATLRTSTSKARSLEDELSIMLRDGHSTRDDPLPQFNRACE
jgi:hypothetical protein